MKIALVCVWLSVLCVGYAIGAYATQATYTLTVHATVTAADHEAHDGYFSFEQVTMGGKAHKSFTIMAPPGSDLAHYLETHRKERVTLTVWRIPQ